eukprot:2873788-Prymnesium_polylepis.3
MRLKLSGSSQRTCRSRKITRAPWCACARASSSNSVQPHTAAMPGPPALNPATRFRRALAMRPTASNAPSTAASVVLANRRAR